MAHICTLMIGMAVATQAAAIAPGPPLRLEGTPWSEPAAASTARLPGPPRQVRIRRVDLPTGLAVHMTPLHVVAPTHPRYVVHHSPDAGFVVTSAHRREAPRRSIGSDHLLALLRNGGAWGGGARVGPHDAGSRPMGSAVGLEPFLAASTLSAFITSGGLLRRLGDGAYEQRIVATQVLHMTGQPVLPRHPGVESQYRELLVAGADFGLRHGLRLGVALTDAQMLKMRADLAWLVEYPVSLPDGSVRAVLVPQVYLLRREAWR